MLAIYILENKNFEINFNINDMIIILKELLNELVKNYHKAIVNFANYKHLLLFYSQVFRISKRNYQIIKHLIIQQSLYTFSTSFNSLPTNITKYLSGLPSLLSSL